MGLKKIVNFFDEINNKKNYCSLPNEFSSDYFSKNLEVLCIYLTLRCNSKCNTCDLWKTRKGAEMEKEAINRDSIAALLSSKYFNNLRAIYFTGGEPTIRKDFLEIIETIYKIRKDLKIAFATNCVDVDMLKKILLFLKKDNISHRVDLSLNGLEESAALAHGLKDQFSRVSDVINFCQTQKIDFNINHTIFPFNYKDTLRFIEMFKKENIIINLGIGRRDSRYGIENKFINWSKTDDLKSILKEIAGHDFRFLSSYLLAKQIEKPRIKCLGLLKKCYIDPYGNVFPCDSREEFLCLGNLTNFDFNFDVFVDRNKKRFSKVWQIIKKKRCQPCDIYCELSFSLEAALPYSRKLRQLFLKYPLFYNLYSYLLR